MTKKRPTAKQSRRRSTVAPVRALHLDLKGLPPTAPRLTEIMELAKASGYNALLVEWEDQFPWKDERFRNETCYSVQEVETFHREAARLGMEIIPLVQCLGHMETWLRPPEFEGLRETARYVDVLNPLAPGAGAFIEGLVDEVLAKTPGCKWFHLGGDEAWTFGTHPDTKAFVEKHGKGALYLKHVEPILDRLIARGVRPILWHDMMLEWDLPALKALGKKADLCVWGYGRYDRVGSPWMKALDKAEAASKPPILQGGGGHAACDALFKRFLAAGVPLWGGGAYKAGVRGLMHPDLPDHEARLINTADWAVFAERFPLQGLMNTAWSRNTTDACQYIPIDAALDLLVAGGLVWSGAAKAAGNLLKPDAAWKAKVLAKSTALLKKRGEATRFEACRDVMHRLNRQRLAGWENAIKPRETLACFESDPRRKSLLSPEKSLGYLKDHQIKSIEGLRGEILKAYHGLIPDLWLNRYVDERLEPLKQEHAELSARLKRLMGG